MPEEIIKSSWHQSFVFISSARGMWRKPRRKGVVSTASTLGIRRMPRTKAPFSRIKDAIGMLGFAWNIVFFRVNGASVAEKSWLACATVAGVVALAWKCSRTARAVELLVPGDFFSSLMMLCYCVLHVLRHFVHWNCCIEEMRSLLELMEFEGFVRICFVQGFKMFPTQKHILLSAISFKRNHRR